MENIILIGFMGSGKTSVGKCLAKKLNVPFCDTDEMIEQQQGMPVSRIFEERGEAFFRELETELVCSLAGKDIGVLSVGGGLAVQPGNGERLKKLGTVLYLRASVDVLFKRLCRDTTRPLLKGGGLREKITSMMSEREEAYIKAADIVLDTDGMGVGAVATLIEKKYQK